MIDGARAAAGSPTRRRTATSNYSVRKFPGYGKLSGKSLDDLRAGERVEVDSAKQDPLDFVLWKKAKEGEPSWDSPWGKGRPGWHIECSAMSSALLGEHFDIHGGGQDLQFPHHENEIAQSEGANQDKFVNYWMHNGFVRVDNEKMSKSLGNFFTVREVLREIRSRGGALLHRARALPQPAQLFRSASRRREAGADAALHRAEGRRRRRRATVDWNDPHAARFREAMDDDFNTPEAVAVLFDLANEVNKTHVARAMRGAAEVAGRDSGAAAARSRDVPARRVTADSE